MLFQLISEVTECDYKESVEVKKTKSWLKSVSAFANGIGGTLLFGVADEKTIVGLSHAQRDAEVMSEKIKGRISPMPNIVLTPYHENGKDYSVGRETRKFHSLLLCCRRIEAGFCAPWQRKCAGTGSYP